MHTVPVAMFGASGYSGIELTYLLARHPRVRLEIVASDRWVGDTVGAHLAIDGPAGRVAYVSPEDAEARIDACKIAFLATPAEASTALAPRLLARGCKVIDLSAAFRRSKDDDASRPEKRASVGVYGLPELYRERISDARLVANPGCYPTAAALALAPLLEEGVVEPEGIVIDAVSGVTGAGRRASEDYGFVAIDGDVRAYKVLCHQHAPEIERVLSERAGANVSLTFTAHLVPLARGILCTSYARLAPGAGGANLRAVFERRYADEPFVTVCAGPDDVSLKLVVGTNRCALGVAWEPRDGGRVVVVSAIDNLVKGAAGQAVQNLNLMLGCEEGTGLTSLRRFHA